MNPIQEFKALLHDSHIENVLIIPHNMPDGDTLGSCIGLYFLMKHFNKRVYRLKRRYTLKFIIFVGATH